MRGKGLLTLLTTPPTGSPPSPTSSPRIEHSAPPLLMQGSASSFPDVDSLPRVAEVLSTLRSRIEALNEATAKRI